jgi:hypothetical protein
MAKITLTIRDADTDRVISALCRWNNVPPSAANAKAAVVQLIRNTVRDIEYADAVLARPPLPDIDTTGVVS